MSALDNAIEILRCFSPAQPEISNADVIRLTGKPKSSTSRLLRQLKECGLLEQDAVTRRYRPGLLLFELGRLHRTENDFVTLTEARLRAVCARTGHTGYIAVLDGAEQVVLRVVGGSNPLQVVTPPGVRAPAYATSNGRAMLARLTDPEIRSHLPKPLPVISPSAPRNATELMARIGEIRRSGYSESSNETLPGVGSLGFALSRRDSAETIGVALSYPSHTTPADERARLWQALHAMAVELGRLFDDPVWVALDERATAEGRGTMSAVRAPVAPIAWLIAPSALLFALFFFLPMGLMALISLLTGNPVVQPNVSFTAKYYLRIVSDPYYFEVIWTTLRIGLLTTLAALLIGYPLAHWMARIRDRTGYAVLMMTVLTPMLTDIVVRTFAWMALLSDKGAINQTLTGLGLISKPLPLMYNEFSIVLGLTHIYVPYMVLTLVGVIGRIDERLEQAAQNLGASPLRAFVEVTLPLSLPGILAGSLLVFALAISAYVTPILMGGFQIMTLPMLIYQQIASSFNVGFAAALGMVLLIISLVLVIAYNRILGLVSGQRELQ